MRRVLLPLLLFVSLPALAVEPFRFEPPGPTTQSFIVLNVDTIWRDSCLPRDAQVTRSGSAIEVLWRIPKSACLPALWPWRDRVAIGVLPAGVYEVRLLVDENDGIRDLARRTLVVADAAGPVSLVVPFASTRGGTDLHLKLTPGLCNGVVTVTIDGAEVPATRLGCDVIVSAPAHAAGAVDVVLRSGEATYSMRAALRYLDPAAPPDPEMFERVLIPLVYNGPGAFGSEWVTEGEIRNLASAPMPWFPDVLRNRCSGCGTSLAAGATLPLSAFGNDADGVVLFIPRTMAEDVRFGARIRDTSREVSSWGTQLPIARESEFAERHFLPNIPVDPRYRALLRIYAVDGVSKLAGVAVKTGEKTIASRVVQLNGPCQASPCNSLDPAFASIDVASLVPAGTAGPISLEIYRASSSPAPVWAFVSITNNTTQQVTIVSPQ